MRAAVTDLDLVLRREEHGESTVVGVGGELDAHTAPRLQAELLEVITGGGTRLVLDLRGLTFLDSTGLGVLLAAHRRLRALDGSLVVVSNRAAVTRLFRITAVDSVIALHTDLEHALAAR